MFVGHYGVSFAAKRAEASIPLWVLFLAVQLLDIVWAVLVLLGVEKVQIAPGAMASTAIGFDYAPYSHSLPSALVLACVASIAYGALSRSGGMRASLIVGAAVLSHWVLDFVVHVGDLPLIGNSMRVGLGLWTEPTYSLALDGVLLLGGLLWYQRFRPGRLNRTTMFCRVLFAVQAFMLFYPPPASITAIAVSALAAYFVFAAVIWLLEDRRDTRSGDGRRVAQKASTNRR
jgi:hypothetical protein